MKYSLVTFPELYLRWMNAGWMMLVCGLPKTRAGESTPGAAQEAANQDWEDEGGSVKPPKYTGMKVVPKIPF